jgi:hypothetical protein
MKKILIALVVIFIGIQFIPVDRTNPPVKEEINAPANVLNILRTSCYDCHSNKTEWPWYSYVAPVSFFVTSDVSEGRKHLNFTEWDRYDNKRREKKLENVVEMIDEGEMPLASYTLMHPASKMDVEKVKVIKDWVKSNGSKNDSSKQDNKDDDSNGHKY